MTTKREPLSLEELLEKKKQLEEAETKVTIKLINFERFFGPKINDKF